LRVSRRRCASDKHKQCHPDATDHATAFRIHLCRFF
jgi:hypothetical protein